MYKIRVENDIFFKSFSLKYQKLENTQRRKIQKLILEMIKFVKKGLMSLHHTHSLYVFRDSSKGGHFPTKLAITMQKSLLA